MGFPDSSVGKESACNAGDPGSIPGLGWSPGEGIAYPLQYSGLENPRDCTAYAVTKSQTWLSDFHYLYRYTFICYPFPSLSSIYYFPAMHNVSLGVFSHLSPHSLHPVSVSNITWLGIKHIKYVYSIPRLPWWLRCKESTCSERDLISVLVGKIPWSRAWQPTPVFLPGEFPWTEEPGGLQSMGSQRVRHDWAAKHSTAYPRPPWFVTLKWYLFDSELILILSWSFPKLILLPNCLLPFCDGSSFLTLSEHVTVHHPHS